MVQRFCFYKKSTSNGSNFHGFFLKEQFTLETMYFWLTFYNFLSTYLGISSVNMGWHPIYAEDFSHNWQYSVSSTKHCFFFAFPSKVLASDSFPHSLQKTIYIKNKL